jgi:hypothetical protein
LPSRGAEDDRGTRAAGGVKNCVLDSMERGGGALVGNWKGGYSRLGDLYKVWYAERQSSGIDSSQPIHVPWMYTSRRESDASWERLVTDSNAEK